MRKLLVAMACVFSIVAISIVVLATRPITSTDWECDKHHAYLIGFRLGLNNVPLMMDEELCLSVVNWPWYKHRDDKEKLSELTKVFLQGWMDGFAELPSEIAENPPKFEI